MRTSYRFGLAVLCVLATLDASSAQTVADVASKWGLVGTWRLDCKQPLSNSNPDLKYVVRDGKLFHDREFGDRGDSSSVQTARRRSDGSIELVVNFSSLSQIREFSFVKGDDGRIRVTSNRDVNTNEFSVRDGKFVANGNTTAWQSRCK